MNDGRIILFISEPQATNRLDVLISDHLKDFTRSRIQALIKDGKVSLDDVPILKTSFQVKGVHEIKVEIPPVKQLDLEPESIPLEILYEDTDLAVINKPAGMVVHPAAGHDTGTLVHAMLAHAPDLVGIGGVERPGIVHRLDKDTSGIIIVAKNDRAQQWLQEQFKNRRVEKTYLALLDGIPATDVGRVEAAIGRDPAHRKKMAIVSAGKGREAVSEYQVVEKFKKHSLVVFHPLTGRTHQIRLHSALLGCPIVGDRVYGLKKSSIPISRHFLHAEKIKIKLPGKKEGNIFEAPLPEELLKILGDLRK